MVERNHRVPPALKHGGFSGIALLPGEDPAAFKKLHDELIDEFGPSGALESDIVETLARLTWRKQNLLTYRLAARAKIEFSQIRSALPSSSFPMPILTLPNWGPEEQRADAERQVQADHTAREQARQKLGIGWQLIELGDVVTTDHLFGELSIVDRIDGMIDRCLKRLLFVRGIKSLSSSASEVPSKPIRKLRTA